MLVKKQSWSMLTKKTQPISDKKQSWSMCAKDHHRLMSTKKQSQLTIKTLVDASKKQSRPKMEKKKPSRYWPKKQSWLMSAPKQPQMMSIKKILVDANKIKSQLMSAIKLADVGQKIVKTNVNQKTLVDVCLKK